MSLFYFYVRYCGEEYFGKYFSFSWKKHPPKIFSLHFPPASYPILYESTTFFFSVKLSPVTAAGNNSLFFRQPKPRRYFRTKNRVILGSKKKSMRPDQTFHNFQALKSNLVHRKKCRSGIFEALKSWNGQSGNKGAWQRVVQAATVFIFEFGNVSSFPWSRWSNTKGNFLSPLIYGRYSFEKKWLLWPDL